MNGCLKRFREQIVNLVSFTRPVTSKVGLASPEDINGLMHQMRSLSLLPIANSSLRRTALTGPPACAAASQIRPEHAGRYPLSQKGRGTLTASDWQAFVMFALSVAQTVMRPHVGSPLRRAPIQEYPIQEYLIQETGACGTAVSSVWSVKGAW